MRFLDLLNGFILYKTSVAAYNLQPFHHNWAKTAGISSFMNIQSVFKYV